MANLIALATFNKCLFLHSIIPFCSSVPIHEDDESCFALLRKGQEWYWNSVWKWVLTILWNSLKILLTSDFSLLKYTQCILVWSSMNVINHLVPIKFVTLKGLHISLWTRAKGLDSFYGCNWKETSWCLDNWQLSHWKKW